LSSNPVEDGPRPCAVGPRRLPGPEEEGQLDQLFAVVQGRVGSAISSLRRRLRDRPRRLLPHGDRHVTSSARDKAGSDQLTSASSTFSVIVGSPATSGIFTDVDDIAVQSFDVLFGKGSSNASPGTIKVPVAGGSIVIQNASSRLREKPPTGIPPASTFVGVARVKICGFRLEFLEEGA
jgi:hypothetical protein